MPVVGFEKINVVLACGTANDCNFTILIIDRHPGTAVIVLGSRS